MTKSITQITKEIKLIDTELDKKITIINKLDYLLESLNNGVNPLLNKKATFHRFLKSFKRKKLNKHLDKFELKYWFLQHLDKAEFKYWFLQHNAELMFNTEIESDYFKSILKDEYSLQGELNMILAIEEKTNKLKLKGKLNSFVKYKNDNGFMYSIQSEKDVIRSVGQVECGEFLRHGTKRDKESTKVLPSKFKPMKLECIEFDRIDKQYYKTNPTEHGYNVFKSPEVKAYYRHKLLKPFLEDKIKELRELNKPATKETEKELHELKEPQLKGITTKTDGKQFSLRQIALIHVYNRDQITRKNGNGIVKKYGYSSGEKLFQHYTLYSDPLNRTSKEETKKLMTNKIKLIKSVIGKLDKDKAVRAIEDVQKLEVLLDKYYY